MMIIIGLIIVLLVIVVVINAVQQHKEKNEQEKRIKNAKQKAIIDESEELISHLSNIPSSPNLSTILYKRAYNAAKAIQVTMPEYKNIKTIVNALKTSITAAQDLAKNQQGQQQEEAFILPDNDQQLVGILQIIKKIRIVLKSEQSKGALDAQTYSAEDKVLDALQLKINIETLIKRGNKAYDGGMVGSSRQYFEKALTTISENPTQSQYKAQKKAELEERLEDITNQLKNANAEDRAKKAKSEEDDLDMLFQPKKKW
jgi:hypothetical protein